MSKQQKQILLFLLKMKPRALHYRSAQIAIQIERMIYDSLRESHPERRYTPIIRISNARMVSICRSLYRLRYEGLLDGLLDHRQYYWYLTDAGSLRATKIKREIEKSIEDLEVFKKFL